MSRVHTVWVIYCNLKAEMSEICDACYIFCRINDPYGLSLELEALDIQLRAHLEYFSSINFYQLYLRKDYLTLRLNVFGLFWELKEVKGKLKEFKARIGGKWHIVKFRVTPHRKDKFIFDRFY